tara:strand:+ start:455 stop:805 length:351 start_codon:yes stop_codon:yes gene_type:complete
MSERKAPVTDDLIDKDRANSAEHLFDGSDYVPARDNVRLSGQIQRVFNVMRDGKPRTLREIAAATGDPEASISAQLRHLRKPKFGSYVVEKEPLSQGLYNYKLLPPEKDRNLELPI